MTSDAPTPTIMTAEQAAAYLSVNDRTLTRWAREGYVPAIPLGEGKRRLWRFRVADLDAWLVKRLTGQVAV
jgi:excisionase family DNA binding protein